MESKQFAIFFLLIFAGLVLFMFNQSSNGSSPFFLARQICHTSKQVNNTSRADALESALSEASMENKTLETARVDFDAEEVYMSQDFIKMMWRRTLFLGETLKKGYSFIFMDADVMWLRNPFPRLNYNQSIDSLDLQISTDSFNGDQWSKDNPINSGFYMIRSNNRTISLFDKCGFCEVGRDFKAVTTVHANCCRTISAKVVDLTAVVHDWKWFKSLTNSNQTSTLQWTNHVAFHNSWKRHR
ncbi:hypothetical protein ACLB2K_074932 [Fragaria x ananassa]